MTLENLQGVDLVADQAERMIKLYRATGKVTDDVRGDRHPVAFVKNLNGLNAVVKRGLRGTLPCPDRYVALIGFIFVGYDGIDGKTILNSGDICAIADREIGRNSVR